MEEKNRVKRIETSWNPNYMRIVCVWVYICLVAEELKTAPKIPINKTGKKRESNEEARRNRNTAIEWFPLKESAARGGRRMAVFELADVEWRSRES